METSAVLTNIGPTGIWIEVRWRLTTPDRKQVFWIKNLSTDFCFLTPTNICWETPQQCALCITCYLNSVANDTVLFAPVTRCPCHVPWWHEKCTLGHDPGFKYMPWGLIWFSCQLYQSSLFFFPWRDTSLTFFSWHFSFREADFINNSSLFFLNLV